VRVEVNSTSNDGRSQWLAAIDAQPALDPEIIAARMDIARPITDGNTVQRVAKSLTGTGAAAVLRLWVVLALACAQIWSAPADSLMGRKAPGWTDLVWVNSTPMSLPELAGKVVLIRWWTAPGCPYCRATAPALNEFHHAYRERGLQVIGFYHHKSPTPLEIEAVKKHVGSFGFEFPVAIDPEWRTLKHWWLNGDARRWTSVSFLLDRHGVVRYIHPGGEYVKGDKDYALLKLKIEELLAEK
jgi:thiol-disulfide isomerase/thioredoxin